MNKLKATARVQITVEISITQPWSSDCTVDQVYKQADKDARSILVAALKPGEHGRIGIIGEPKVIAVFAEREA